MRIHDKAKVFFYTTMLPIMTVATSTPVHADNDEAPKITINDLNQLRNMRNSGEAKAFFTNFGKLLDFLRGICLLTVGIAFAMTFLSLIVQAGKLGGASVIEPEGNTRKRQEAYDGIMNTMINFGIIGGAGAIFAALSKFMLGI